MTSLSLLARARADEQDAWTSLVNLYRPLVYHWSRRSLEPADAEDMVQDVLTVVARKLREFEHNGRKGAFRTWMRTITRNLIIDRHRRLIDETVAAGGTTAHEMLQELTDRAAGDPTDDEVSQETTLLYHRAIELIRHEYSDRDNTMFQRVVANGESPSNVAQDMGVTANTVSIVVSRIKKRFRDQFGQAIHE